MFQEAAINHIAGYIVKCLQTKLNCDECNLALLSADGKAHPLIEQKDRGGLCWPSESVVTLCKEAEKVIQRLLRKLGGKLPKGPGFVEAICTAVLSNTRDISLFPGLLKHQFETLVEDNHIHQLTKKICCHYARIRDYHIEKKHTEMFTGQTIRNHLKKTILFKNQ